MRKSTLTLFILLTIRSFVFGQAPTPDITYSFEAGLAQDDQSTYMATLLNGTIITDISGNKVLSLGSMNGYMDLGATIGTVIGTLTNFTMSTDIFIDLTTNLATNGNFVWTFSNSTNAGTDKNGYFFFGANVCEFNITKTDWGSAKVVKTGNSLTKGIWKNITYVQKDALGTLYIDGIVSATGTIDLYPSNVGNTTYNFLGRSSYSSDIYLKNALYDNFSIYKTALTATEVKTLSTNLATLNQVALLNTAINTLTLGDLTSVTKNLTLPTTFNGFAISWKSSDAQLITDAGQIVSRPTDNMNKTVTLTATMTSGSNSVQKQFSATLYSYEHIAQLDSITTTIPIGYAKNLHWDLVIDSIGKYGSTISWKSNNATYVSDKGKLLKLTANGAEKVNVTMTATISISGFTKTKSFDLLVANEEQTLDGYLFAYFEGSGTNALQEQLRFAVSADAVNWYALNNNQPIMASSLISKSGGVRDPHILRGEDGKTFYMVATDMFAIQNGWTSNPGIVLMKSTDLTNWTHSIIDFPTTYPAKFGNACYIWAPQTIYDPAADKYLVYFTIKYFNSSVIYFYCAYANASFTALEGEPKLMFSTKEGAIDSDIIYKDGTYHFFFKGNTKDASGVETNNGIMQAFGKTLQGPWTEDFKFLDVYSAYGPKTSVEGSSVFKLNNSTTYILMYDLYSSLRYEFQRSTDLYTFTSKSESFTKNFNPRHGTVTGITKQEATALNAKWGGVPSVLITDLHPIKSTANLKKKLTSIHNELYIDSDEMKKVDIYSIDGKLVKTILLSIGRNTVPIMNGIYILD